MNEISLFLDKEKKEPVEDTINFGVIPIGEMTTRDLYIQNNIDHLMTINLGIKGEDIFISGKNFEVMPKEMIRVSFDFTPKKTKLQPIKGELNIKIKYIVG